MKKELKQKLSNLIQKAQKANEQSVYLKDLRDAEKSNKQQSAEIAIKEYNKFHRS
jgi:hypothetical protein